MSPLAADLVGLAGSAIMIAAFAYSNLAAQIDLLRFNLLNALGAVLLIASLLVHFNLASFALEVVWLAIALAGAGRALAARRRA